jgi:hypothetical protein
LGQGGLVERRCVRRHDLELAGSETSEKKDRASMSLIDWLRVVAEVNIIDRQCLLRRDGFLICLGTVGRSFHFKTGSLEIE